MTSSAFSVAHSATLGVLLVNLGTPDAPTVPAVRRFLAEFLWDKRVIDYPRPLWWLILNGIILRIRPRKSAHAYAQIWTKEGSPLLLQSTALANAIQSSLGPQAKVVLGMTYGSPSIATALRTLREQKINRIVVVPLYPQYSGTTTGSVFDRVAAELRLWPILPELHFVPHYHEREDYLDALAQSVRDHWKTHERKHLFFSFHGIPLRYVSNGDPYYDHCVATARGVTGRLQLQESEWTLAFQSRVTRERWLEPYTDKQLVKFAQSGPKNVCVICPAFATDNLETLEEIDIRNREDFLAVGGESYDYIPCLNTSDAHVKMFVDLINRSCSHTGT